MNVMCIGVPTPELDEVLRRGSAFLPIPVSAATGIRGATLRTTRATVFWLQAIPRVNEAETLIVVGAPVWAKSRIRRARESGLGTSALKFVTTSSQAAALLVELAHTTAEAQPDTTQS